MEDKVEKDSQLETVAAKAEVSKGIKLLDLPIEILRAIIDNFQIPQYLLKKWDYVGFSWWEEDHKLQDSRRTLCALSQTCKLVHSMAKPVLYTCLLHTSYDSTADHEALVCAIQHMAESNPSLLSHTRQIQIPASLFSILQHTSKLTGLMLDHPDSRHIAIPLPQHLPETTFQHLSHLQSLHIVRWGCADADVAPMLQNLYHLRNLYFVRLAYLEAEAPFEMTTWPLSLRELELAGCCAEVTLPLLEVLSKSALQSLDVSEYELVGDEEESVSEEMPEFPLQIFTDAIISGDSGYFSSLRSFTVANATIFEAAMIILLQWLPMGVDCLHLRTVGSVDIIKPLYLWIQRFGATRAGMRVTVRFHERSVKASQHQEDLWTETLAYTRKLMDLAEAHDILILPKHLPTVVLDLMSACIDQDSSSEEGGLTPEDFNEESDIGIGDNASDIASIDEGLDAASHQGEEHEGAQLPL